MGSSDTERALSSCGYVMICTVADALQHNAGSKVMEVLNFMAAAVAIYRVLAKMESVRGCLSMQPGQLHPKASMPRHVAAA